MDYITRERFDLVQCKECSLIFVNPLPKRDEIARYYPVSYYGNRRSFFELFTIRSRIKKIKKMYQNSTSGKILDIGCGRGRLLYEMKKEGWDVFGTELSEHSCSMAREEFNLDIKKGDIKDCRFPDNYFDVITMWHFLEHYHDPSELLKESYRILKDGGLLIISVPNIGSLQYYLSKKKWFHLDVPRHLYHFTLNTLSRLIKLNRFNIINKNNFSFEYDVFGFMQSMLNIISSTQNLLFKLISRDIDIKDIFTSRDRRITFDLFLILLFTPILLISSTIISPIASLFGVGGTIEIYMRKNENNNILSEWKD